jgi:hypothetical protein
LAEEKKVENKQIEDIEQEIKEYELEHKNKLKNFKIIEKPTYKKMVCAIRMMTENLKTLHGVLINSRPGIGKTMTTQILLNQLDAKYIELNNHLTKKEFFILLQENKDKIIVIDDVDKLLESSQHIALLKKALETVPYGREIQYNTSTKIKDDNGKEISKKFIFSGKIIILTNKVKEDDKHINAVKDRVLYLRLSPSNEDIIEIMEYIVKNPLPDSTELNLDQRTEVKEFIKNKMNERANLSLRTLVLGYEFMADSIQNNDKDSWKTNLLESDEELDSVLIAGKINADEKFQTKEDRAKEYNRLTHKSVAEYYRDLRQYIDIYKKS